MARRPRSGRARERFPRGRRRVLRVLSVLRRTEIESLAAPDAAQRIVEEHRQPLRAGQRGREREADGPVLPDLLRRQNLLGDRDRAGLRILARQREPQRRTARGGSRLRIEPDFQSGGMERGGDPEIARVRLFLLPGEQAADPPRRHPFRRRRPLPLPRLDREAGIGGAHLQAPRLGGVGDRRVLIAHPIPRAEPGQRSRHIERALQDLAAGGRRHLLQRLAGVQEDRWRRGRRLFLLRAGPHRHRRHLRVAAELEPVDLRQAIVPHRHGEHRPPQLRHRPRRLRGGRLQGRRRQRLLQRRAGRRIGDLGKIELARIAVEPVADQEQRARPLVPALPRQPTDQGVLLPSHQPRLRLERLRGPRAEIRPRCPRSSRGRRCGRAGQIDEPLPQHAQIIAPVAGQQQPRKSLVHRLRVLRRRQDHGRHRLRDDHLDRAQAHQDRRLRREHAGRAAHRPRAAEHPVDPDHDPPGLLPHQRLSVEDMPRGAVLQHRKVDRLAGPRRVPLLVEDLDGEAGILGRR
jgi:hypothetical protein